MNRNLALFLLSVITIAVFGVVVMMSVPRKGIVEGSMPDASTVKTEEFVLAKTDSGFSELPDRRGSYSI